MDEVGTSRPEQPTRRRTVTWLAIAAAVIVIGGLAAVVVALRDNASSTSAVNGTWDLEDPGFAPKPEAISLEVRPDSTFAISLYGGNVRCSGTVSADGSRYRFAIGEGECEPFTAELADGDDRLQVSWDEKNSRDNDTLVRR